MCYILFFSSIYRRPTDPNFHWIFGIFKQKKILLEHS